MSKAVGGRHLPPSNMVGTTGAARILDCDKRTIGRMVAREELTVVEVRGVKWFDRQSVVDLALARKASALAAFAELLKTPPPPAVQEEPEHGHEPVYRPEDRPRSKKRPHARYRLEGTKPSPSSPRPPRRDAGHSPRGAVIPPPPKLPRDQEPSRVRPARLAPAVYEGWAKSGFKTLEDIERETQESEPPTSNRGLAKASGNPPSEDDDSDEPSESDEQMPPKSRRHG